MSEITSRLSIALGDRYRIERRLGEGGMATVYLAEDVKHKRKVALKVLKPDLAAVLGADRFVQEITTTASLQHPNILPLFDSGEADGFLFYVMPFIEGETLREKLNRETQLGINEAVAIATDVAEALQAAHEEGVVHRDIKPENILLHKGRAMVADFGIALAVSAAAGGRMTETGLSLGTPHYMSPEQATAEKDITARSDVYSLGTVLYEMLAGAPPHLGGSAQQIIMKIVTDMPRPVTELRKSVPPNVAAAVARALEKLAADRFESAVKFAEALANPTFTVPALGGATVGALPGRDRRVPLALTAVATLFGAAALAGWLRPRPEVSSPVVRYSLELPAVSGGSASSGWTGVAVSPDRSRLVYVGPADGGVQLWVRHADQFDAIPLAGTAGASAPFFSPDGAWVAFAVGEETGLSNGSIAWRKIPVNGGSPVTVADVGLGGLGGAWGADGFLYFDGELPGQGIVRVPEGGGVPEPLTIADTAHGEFSHIWPEVLPEGRGVLFTVRSTGPALEGWSIAVADLATGAHTVLVPGVRVRYAASGHLVYVTADQTLTGVSFDESALEVTGEPVALIEGIAVRQFFGAPDFALSDTGTLIYTAARGSSGSEVVWVGRDGTATSVDPDWEGDFVFPRLSPDGTRLAVRIGEHIWVKQLDRGPAQRITSVGNNIVGEWITDGRALMFSSDRGGDLDLYIRRSDASAPAELLLDREEVLGGQEQSPDGEWLVYVDFSNMDVYAVRTGDSIPVPLLTTQSTEVAPAVSPDGRWLAYQSDESGQFEVYVSPFPNTGESKVLVSRAGGTEPVWARNGRELFYKERGYLVAVEILPGASFELGERRTLFSLAPYRETVGFGAHYDVAPDGQRFVMVRNRARETGRTELMVVENFFAELRAKVGN